MPLFSRFKSKGAQPASKGKNAGDNGNLIQPKQPRWQSRWESTEIVPDEIKELIHVCTAEMKSRAEALDAPFLLLPFRPDSDPQGARTFVRNFYKANAEHSSQYRGESLRQELRLTDSVVLCSILKWCWSRMPNGVVSWPVYEGFRIGEKEAQEARNAFSTFIPIGSDSEARQSIIFDFYDLLASIAAHGKNNGLTGRKVSRMAGWWAFEHSDDGKGFEGGYKSWTAAADASSHLFFAYLRSLSPDTNPSMNVIERIPRSLQALLASTEYPPETPTLLQRTTARVVMVVDTVSPTPFALLRRAKNFEYRDRDRVLREFAEFEDPLDALTEECKRVLYAVSTANQSSVARSRKGLVQPDESWNAFSNIGFADLDEKALSQKSPSGMNGSTKTVGQGLRDQPASRHDAGRPTTPSWADFLSSGFVDDGTAKSPTLLYPPAHVLPPLGSRSSSPGHMHADDEQLAPGELAAITSVDLDDAFWWVWMTSLAGEEPTSRKAVFGRCTLIETTIMNGQWLIMEEQVKGASPDPALDAYIAPKKSLFSFTKRGRLSRKRSTTKQSPALERTLSATPSKTSISTDQHAKIKAAARALTSKQEATNSETARRGRYDEPQSTKTNSTLTMGLQSEAGPAMKWASSYDKNAIRSQYLSDSYAGKGASREDLRRASSANINNFNTESSNAAAAAAAAAASPVSPAFSTEPAKHDVPRASKEEVVETALPALPAELASGPEPPVDSTKPVDEFTEPTLDGDAFATADAPPPELARPASAMADKEIAVEPITPTSSGKVGRKPVPSIQGHPAFRGPIKEEKIHSSPPATNPAALAAARAMGPTNTSPDSGRSRKPVSTGAGAGIKKLFGKKGQFGRGDSFEAPRPVSNGLAAPSESGIGRRLSMMRKKPATASAPKTNQPAQPAQSAAATAARTAASAAAMQEPVVNTNQMYYTNAQAAVSRSSIGEHEAAEREFSRFDQGPMEDMPDAVPAESEDESSPPVEQRKFNTLLASRMHAQGDSGAVLPFDAPTSDVESEVTMEDNHDAAIVQDRWATIRENAHRRAAEQRASEDHDTQSRPSQSMRTDDDGETSGEETIESRVARIKARVAELTGNMDSSARA